MWWMWLSCRQRSLYSIYKTIRRKLSRISREHWNTDHGIPPTAQQHKHSQRVASGSSSQNTALIHLSEFHTPSFPATLHPIHTPLRLPLDYIRRSLNQRRQPQTPRVLGQKFPIRIIDHVVNIHLRHAVLHVLADKFAVVGSKPFCAGTVEDELDAAFGGVADALEAVELQLGTAFWVFACQRSANASET